MRRKKVEPGLKKDREISQRRREIGKGERAEGDRSKKMIRGGKGPNRKGRPI